PRRSSDLPAPNACRKRRRFIGCNIQCLLPGRRLDGWPRAVIQRGLLWSKDYEKSREPDGDWHEDGFRLTRKPLPAIVHLSTYMCLSCLALPAQQGTGHAGRHLLCVFASGAPVAPSRSQGRQSYAMVAIPPVWKCAPPTVPL